MKHVLEMVFDRFVGWLATPSVLLANVAYMQDSALNKVRDWLEASGINQIITTILAILIMLYWGGKLYEMYCRHWRPEKYKKIKPKKDV